MIWSDDMIKQNSKEAAVFLGDGDVNILKFEHNNGEAYALGFTEQDISNAKSPADVKKMEISLCFKTVASIDCVMEELKELRDYMLTCRKVD